MIELTKIIKRYQEYEVLRGVSLTVADGEVCVLLGPSGGGKSTLLRTINGLETFDSGTIRVGDVMLPASAGPERAMRYKQPAAYLKHALGGAPAAATRPTLPPTAATRPTLPPGAATRPTLPTMQEMHEVPARDLPFEFMMNALRLRDGVPASLFQERTGLPIHAITRELDAAEQRGLLERNHATIKPTPSGRRFLNDLLQLFLPQNDGAGVV